MRAKGGLLSVTQRGHHTACDSGGHAVDRYWQIMRQRKSPQFTYNVSSTQRDDIDDCDTSLTQVQVYVERGTSKQIPPQLSPLSRKKGWISPLNELTVWPLLKRGNKNVLWDKSCWGFYQTRAECRGTTANFTFILFYFDRINVILLSWFFILLKINNPQPLTGIVHVWQCGAMRVLLRYCNTTQTNLKKTSIIVLDTSMTVAEGSAGVKSGKIFTGWWRQISALCQDVVYRSVPTTAASPPL